MAVTAFGLVAAGVEEAVPQTLAGLDVDVVQDSLRKRYSKTGKYVSVTMTFQCPSRDKYEQVHAALRLVPGVKYTL